MKAVEGWSSFTVEQCCDILDSMRVPVNAEDRDKRIGEIPYYGANGLQGYIDDFIFDEPLILIAEDGGCFEEFTTRPIAYRIKGKSWVNNHAHVLRAKEPFCQDAVFYNLEHKDIQSLIVGGTRSKLNQVALRAITFTLPTSKPEQTKIAEVLSTVDRAIEQTEALIAKQQRIKTGLMQDLLTRGIDEHGNLRSEQTHPFKDSPLGRIPMEWEACLLREIVAITRLAGYEYSTYWRPVENGEIISLRGYNVGKNKIIEREFERISDRLSRRLVRSRLFKGNVVFPCVGTIGNAALIREDNRYHINQNIAKITPTSRIDGSYLVHYLMSELCRVEIDRFNASSSQPNVLVGSLRQFRVPIPTVIEEQKRIAEMLSSQDDAENQERSHLVKLRALKTALMQDLLTGKKGVTALIDYTENEIL